MDFWDTRCMSRPPLFRPQDVPVVGVDAHLPPRQAAHWEPAALRDRFARHPHWEPEWQADPRFTQREPTAAAVLMSIVLRPEPTLLFTRRTEHLDAHPGQISFPGGRTEPEDADAVATALREAQEEIGLGASHFEVLGQLPLYTTGTSFLVTPVVALLRPPYEARPDPFEVAEVFEVPLSFLMNPAHHRHHAIEWMGQERRFLSMPWQGEAPLAQPGEYFIWGATAAMLRNFYQFLGL